MHRYRSVYCNFISQHTAVENAHTSLLIRTTGGTLQQKVSSCLQTLDHLMKQSNTIVASMIVAEKRYADSDIINIVANILGNI